MSRAIETRTPTRKKKLGERGSGADGNMFVCIYETNDFMYDKSMCFRGTRHLLRLRILV